MPTSNLSPIFQVHEFNETVGFHLQQLGEVVVEGEISQMRISQGKWLFMTIKDNRASVDIFAPAFRLSTLNALEEGMKVHVYGRASIYTKTGRFSLNASQIVPAGEGALKLAYEKLKIKLEQEGLFDPARKRKLLKFVEKIALITAKNSRAYSDFVKILFERVGGIKIYFYPAQVQGKDSVSSLLEALEYFQTVDLNLDALVITRGGGSLEDLLSFNDESIARAVFASKIPVISGIGHEEDITLIDLVADVRASTPSNAAELLMEEREKIFLQIEQLLAKAFQANQQQFQIAKEKIVYQTEILESFFNNYKSNLGELTKSLEQTMILNLSRIDLKKQHLVNLAVQLNKASKFQLETFKQKLAQIERLLSNFDYKQVLQRGFSLTRNEQGKIISSKKHLKIDDQISTQLSDGLIESIITNLRKDV